LFLVKTSPKPRKNE